jgi:2-oxoglutarate ferredoxin oxidoreductase subunit alpha
MRLEAGTYFMQGNEACVEGAIAAGLRFFAGYPITPSTEIAERLAERLPKEDGIFIQMEDEIASISAAIGSSWVGAKAMTATSGPGFSLMQENIGYAAMTETPLVIVNVMRGGPSTGLPTMPSQGDVMQAKYGSHGDYEIIALSPATVQDMFDLTIKAFNFSETYRVPAIILSDAEVGHMRGKFTVPKKFWKGECGRTRSGMTALHTMSPWFLDSQFLAGVPVSMSPEYLMILLAIQELTPRFMRNL